MNRRDFVKGMGLGAVSTLMTSNIALGEEHKHGGKIEQRTKSKALKAVIDSARDCLATGETCLAHCNAALAAGHTDMAACQQEVTNMMALCEAMVKTGTHNTADEKNLKALAKTCSDFCKSCATACEKHAGHHTECKKCMESCQACAKACDSYVS